MRDERELRRPDFRPGLPIRLADGQSWTFPDPPDRAGEDTARFDPEYRALVAALLEAEDDVERLRTELALAIHLLARNYDLRPADYAGILEYPPSAPGLGALQRALHAVALEHLRHLRQPTGKAPARRTWSWPFRGPRAPIEGDRALADSVG